MHRSTPARLALLAASCLTCSTFSLLAQEARPADKAPTALPRPVADPSKEEIDSAVTRGVALLLDMQESMDEGKPKAEWPYEGVYRVNRQIPVGYRIGGTSIVCMALLEAPGYATDDARKEAIARSIRFVLDTAKHPLMNPDYDGGYDVRGWGYTYRLLFLLQLKRHNAIPADLAKEVEDAILWDINAIQMTEIPRVGGWNYARSAGKDAVSPPSPFMTAPTLEALFNARALGYKVNDEIVNRAIETLLKQRSATGSYVYSGATRENRAPEPIPGAVGRMLAAESTLFTCGKSSLLHIRAALDAFIAHWEWLDKRRAKSGTHEGPYGVAPYYFYYAHFYAARAIEHLPERERAEYRRRVARLLFSVRLDDGSWNDRVFPRSRSYGTAMSLMALTMADAAPPAQWAAAEAGNAVAPLPKPVPGD